VIVRRGEDELDVIEKEGRVSERKGMKMLRELMGDININIYNK
jgi:hypothetical protein